MNVKISEFVICVEVIIYLLLHNLHDCTFNHENADLYIKPFLQFLLPIDMESLACVFFI